jgi:dTDP-4-amino-4,6-dideoxygalactose transaminase
MQQSKVVQLPLTPPKHKVLVTQPYVPSLDKYMHYVKKAFDDKWLTNDGPLLKELTERLKDYLGVKYLLLVSNGTAALQLAYKIKNLSGKNVISTPFTFPATTTALEWQNANVILSDINKDSWNLDPHAIEQRLTKSDISAIVPVNIFGMPCDMEAFDKVGKAHKIPIIYDSAQSMLAKHNGKSVLQYGDIHCMSFHATKLFHTVEGGALTFNNKEDYERAQRLINFGIGENGVVGEAGINAKMSELHAAMGLCILDDLPMLIENREESVSRYHNELADVITFQKSNRDTYTPPMYMPVKFETEDALLNTRAQLNKHGYTSRRYFYPKNHEYLQKPIPSVLPVSDAVSNKILCLPLMHNLNKTHIISISKIVQKHA